MGKKNFIRASGAIDPLPDSKGRRRLLLPCPFCGEVPQIKESPQWKDCFYIKCYSSNCSVYPQTLAGAKQTVIENGIQGKSNMKNHVMVDIETLSLQPDALILSIGAVRFSEEGLGETLYIEIDISDSLQHDRRVDGETLKWWISQDEKAKRVLTDRGKEIYGPLSLRAALGLFNDWIASSGIDDTIIWAKGPQFDIVVLEQSFKRLGFHIPWKYNNIRDFRTLLKLGTVQKELNYFEERLLFKDTVKHNALDDAMYQADLCRMILIELDLGWE